MPPHHPVAWRCPLSSTGTAGVPGPPAPAASSPYEQQLSNISACTGSCVWHTGSDAASSGKGLCHCLGVGVLSVHGRRRSLRRSCPHRQQQRGSKNSACAGSCVWHAGCPGRSLAQGGGGIRQDQENRSGHCRKGASWTSSRIPVRDGEAGGGYGGHERLRAWLQPGMNAISLTKGRQGKARHWPPNISEPSPAQPRPH